MRRPYLDTTVQNFGNNNMVVITRPAGQELIGWKDNFNLTPA